VEGEDKVGQASLRGGDGATTLCKKGRKYPCGGDEEGKNLAEPYVKEKAGRRWGRRGVEGELRGEREGRGRGRGNRERKEGVLDSIFKVDVLFFIVRVCFSW